MLIEEYENMLGGDCLEGESVDFSGELEVDPEILEVLSGMDDEDLAETTIDYPELMGRLFRRLRARRKYRKKLAKKLKGLPRRKMRRVIRKLLGKRTKLARIALMPGTRLARAMLLRKRSRKGKERATKRRVARRKRWTARRKARRSRIFARRSKRQARRVSRRRPVQRAQPVAQREAVASVEYADAPATRREQKRQERGMLQFPGERGGPEQIEEMDVLPPQGPDFMKFLPLVAAAVAIPFLLPKKKA